MDFRRREPPRPWANGRGGPLGVLVDGRPFAVRFSLSTSSPLSGLFSFESWGLLFGFFLRILGMPGLMIFFVWPFVCCSSFSPWISYRVVLSPGGRLWVRKGSYAGECHIARLLYFPLRPSGSFPACSSLFLIFSSPLPSPSSPPLALLCARRSFTRFWMTKRSAPGFYYLLFLLLSTAFYCFFYCCGYYYYHHPLSFTCVLNFLICGYYCILPFALSIFCSLIYMSVESADVCALWLGHFHTRYIIFGYSGILTIMTVSFFNII